MSQVEIYTKDYCPYCQRAKILLEIKGIDYTEHDVTEDLGLEALMRNRSQRKTVPQIFIGAVHIGGCDDLFALDERGELDPLLEQIAG